MKKQKQIPIVATYPEKARTMANDARAELKQLIAVKFAELQQLAKTSQATAVRGVNVAREIGEQIELFTGHQKLLPGEFKQIVQDGSVDVTIKFAKTCLLLHRKFPAAIEDYATAAPEWKVLHEQMDLLPKPARGAELVHPSEPVRDFLTEVGRVAKEWISIADEFPLSTWDDHFRLSFLRSCEPIHDLYEKAVALERATPTR